MNAVTLNNVCKQYQSVGDTPSFSLENISFSVEQEIFVLVGANGSGKTTLLSLIAGFTNSDSGNIKVEGVETRPIFGYLWQDYRQSNLPWLSVLDNVGFPLVLKGKSKQESRKIAENLINDFAPEISREKPVYQLSGGQQQVVALLRSICAEPDVILADEPFSAFDQRRRWDSIEKFEQIWLRLKKPVVWVSHDIDEALLIADRIGLLSKRTKDLKIMTIGFPRPRVPSELLRSQEFMTQRNEIIDFLSAEY
jgi:NitT/TauT family transport system ATP-binding protein